MQDFEFTIQEGKAVHAADPQRQAHRPSAAVKIASDMVKEKLIDWKTAITRVPADSSTNCSRRFSIATAVKKAKAMATGLPAGPGAASGKIYSTPTRGGGRAERREGVCSFASKPARKICAA